MRTTIDLDEDILRVVKHMALEQHQSIGKVLSALARFGLQPKQAEPSPRGVIPVLARKPGARPVTSQIVKDLQELDS